jgi:hypothetical protein
MTAPVDITGERYGRLVALRRLPGVKGKTIWLFRCDCGTECAKHFDNVRAGRTLSCGCLHDEKVKTTNLKHGHSANGQVSRTFLSYMNAKSRCYNPRNRGYAEYGGRGIYMCDRWINSFQAFLEDMGECPPGRSIDRIDVNGPYAPENCRWATPREQAVNRRSTVWVTIDGEKLCMADFAKKVGVPYKTIQTRVYQKKLTPRQAVGLDP